MSNTETVKKKHDNNSGNVVASILYIVLGIYLLRYPDMAIRTVCLGFGVITLCLGIFRLVVYFSKKIHGFWGTFDLPVGIILTAIGIVLLMSPSFVVSIIPMFIGLIILYNSVVKIREAIALKAIEHEKWWSMLIVGVIMLLLGCYVVLNPFDVAARSVQVVGIILIIIGCLSVSGTVFTDFSVHKYKKAQEATYRDAETGETGEAQILDKDGNVIG